MYLPDVGGRLICQKDSFLCAAKGVAIGIYFQRKILTGLFGGEGFIMQKLEGDGLCFVHAGGTIVERILSAGETLHVATGCVVAFQDSVNFDIQQVGEISQPFSGVRDCSTQFCRDPEKSGCNPFPSPAWRAGCWQRLHRRPAAAAKARSWEDWVISSMAITRSRSLRGRIDLLRKR